jgi:hypothetical protein
MRMRYSERAPSFSPRTWRCVAVSRGPFEWLGERRDGPCADEDVVPTVGCSVATLYWLALEWSELETETLARRWSELSVCCSAATLRMFFIYWYTLLTRSVEGVGRVSKSVAVTATFWLALRKVGCGIPSWLMMTAMALDRARAFV